MTCIGEMPRFDAANYLGTPEARRLYGRSA